MPRIVLALLVAWVWAALALDVPAAPAPELHAAPQSCTNAQKAKATKALKAFKRTMAAKRNAYFRTHRSAKAKKGFVKRQNAKLKTLQRAARCQARPATPATPLQPPLPPPPQPPPAPPPLTGPGAPATYVFGPELSAQEQAIVIRGLDAGARYYRAILGRELPPFTVWAYRDLDALVQAFSQQEPSYSPERARQLWEAGQVGHATPRKVWFGPNYFVAGRPGWQALTIAAHESFHLFQYELAGQRALSVSSLDEIPTAGPWWLAEGTAQYFAFLAIVREGVIPLDEVRRAWVLSTKQSTATLRDLATLRGQMGWPSYDIYSLATEALLRGRDPSIVFTYYEAIGRGVPWPDAFATTFGRSFDAFVDEFEAYRIGL